MRHCIACDDLSPDPICFVCKLAGRFQCWQCGQVTEEPVSVEIHNRLESFCPSCYGRSGHEYKIKLEEVT
jgi:NAD-dependent SIR2 family protein deacetylase